MSGSANYRSIYQKVLMSAKFQNAAVLRAKLKYTQAKKLFFTEFVNHPVTKEISDGPEADNSSGTLGGYGNLFSFIGFEEGRRPIQEIEEALESMFSFNRAANTTLSLTFKITYPDINKLKKYSTLAWAFGGSWISGIEKGIPNFAQYVYGDTILTSRSGSGIQSKNDLRGVNFIPVPYLTPMLEKFKIGMQNK